MKLASIAEVQPILSKENIFSLSAMLERLVSTLYLFFLKNNLKFNAEKLSVPSFLCIFAKELRIKARKI